MVLLEDQHWPQSNRRCTTAADVDTQSLHLSQELIPLRVVERNESSLPFPSQILELLRIFLCEILNASIEVVAHHSGIFNQIQTLNFIDDGSEEDCASRIAHPRVELTVGFVGSQGGIAEVVSSCLCFLGESDHVRRI